MDFFVVVDSGSYHANGATFGPGRHHCTLDSVREAIEQDNAIGVTHIRIEEPTDAELEALEAAAVERAEADERAREEAENQQADEAPAEVEEVPAETPQELAPASPFEGPLDPATGTESAPTDETEAAAPAGPGAPLDGGSSPEA
jgi:hypothetical protein